MKSSILPEKFDFNTASADEKMDFDHCLGDRELEKVLKTLPRGLRAKPAESEEELRAAYRLVYREYVSRGYCETNDILMYYHSHCLLPSSRTFILEYNHRVLGTASLIPDSPCGVPLETALPHLAGELRFSGRRFAEVSLLTLDIPMFSAGGHFSPHYKLVASFLLFQALLNYARHAEKITDLLIIVHPGHESLYRNLFFKPAGDVISYAGALGNPGLPMHLDIVKLEKNLPKDSAIRKFFLGNSVALDQLRKSWERTSILLENLLEKTSQQWEGVFKGAEEYLKRRYLSPKNELPSLVPTCDFSTEFTLEDVTTS